MNKKIQITISRLAVEGKVSRKNWKELISSLVLAGYEVYGDEDKIIFILGNEDSIEEIKDE